MVAANIVPMARRKYVEIPVDRIKVLNSRNRDKVQFQENIRSIKDVGLLKPIVVNERNFKKTGWYELVCGEGRYLAYKELGRSHIPAEVISCNKKESLLISLVENIARIPPDTMWFAYEVKRMHDSGWTLEHIVKVVGKCETYIRDYIKLTEQGEERLIKGVEKGLFPMTFALQVARSDNATIQNVLMDAFDAGIIDSNNTQMVRKIIELRVNCGKKLENRWDSSGRQTYSLNQLKADISRVTKEKEAFVNEANFKQTRLLIFLEGLKTLHQDQEVVEILKSEGLANLPEMKGAYNV